MIIVADPDAARRALAERRLCCPKDDCGGVLRQWQQAVLHRLGVADPTDVLGVQVTG